MDVNRYANLPDNGGGGAMKRSPLHDRHQALQAKLVPFGGWEMPLSYPSGTIAEHLACRRAAAMFDVSHLGSVRVSGPGAFEKLNTSLTNDLGRIEPGRAQYTHLLSEEDGSVVDDIIVWWVSDDVFDVMPNASNTERVILALSGSGATAVDTTADRAVISVQGPLAHARLASVVPEAAEVDRFRVQRFDDGLVVAGTGYTGEAGVEIAVPTAAAGELWDRLLAADIVPAGLAARDTLRLEAGLVLHGNELGPGITPLHADLNWVVAWKKGPFRGRDALAAVKDAGVDRILRGLVVSGRRPPRTDQGVYLDGARVGTVSSGNFSPVLERGIAMAFLDSAVGVGSGVMIDMRGTMVAAEVVDLPFVARH
jgi:aminomethyltransferase